jgi:hypothetical protein
VSSCTSTGLPRSTTGGIHQFSIYPRNGSPWRLYGDLIALVDLKEKISASCKCLLRFTLPQSGRPDSNRRPPGPHMCVAGRWRDLPCGSAPGSGSAPVHPTPVDWCESIWSLVVHSLWLRMPRAQETPNLRDQGSTQERRHSLQFVESFLCQQARQRHLAYPESSATRLVQ